MMRPIEVTASAGPVATGGGGAAGRAAGVGVDCAAGAGTAAGPLAACAALRMSSARISPPGPDPLSLAMSTPCSRASRRAFGEIFAPATDAGSGAAGAAAAAVAAGADSIFRPLCDWAPPVGTASPGFSSHAMVCPTGTTSPTFAVTPDSTPSPPASISTTALSVSTSSSISPFLTCSPSFFFHETSLPVSCAISSAGITTLTAISDPLRLFRPWALQPSRRRQPSLRLPDWAALRSHARAAVAHRPSRTALRRRATPPPGIA